MGRSLTDACLALKAGALDGNAFRALSTVLESKEVDDQAGEILQEALWTAEVERFKFFEVVCYIRLMFCFRGKGFGRRITRDENV